MSHGGNAADPDVHTHRHVLGRPCEGTCSRADELARNSKVAQFDDALSREEYIGRLDVAVNDLLGMQVCETLEDLGRRNSRRGRSGSRKVRTWRRERTGEHSPPQPRLARPSLPRGPYAVRFVRQ